MAVGPRDFPLRVHRRDRRRKPQMLVRSHSVRSGSVDDVEGNFDEDIRIMLWKCTSRTSWRHKVVGSARHLSGRVSKQPDPAVTMRLSDQELGTD